MDVQQPCSSGTSSSLLETIDTTMDASNKLPTYCYCNGPEEGEMVGCESKLCLKVVSHQAGFDTGFFARGGGGKP